MSRALIVLANDDAVQPRDRREYKRKWAAENPDKTRAYQKAWAEKHPEGAERARKLAAERSQKWRDENPELSRLRAKKHREKEKVENPDAIKARRSRFYENNKEKMNAYAAKWRLENKAYLKIKDKEWRDNNKHKIKDTILKRAYGISLSEYNNIFERQGYSCAACGEENPTTKRKWAVDHCHDTGKVRGILCHHCNLTLGNAKENATRLRLLAAYIEIHRDEVNE